MLNPVHTNVFKRDVKKVKKRGKNMSSMKKIINDLINEVQLDMKYKDHALVGSYKGDRECHIEPDWLLIYTIKGCDLILVRTGSHSDLFK